MIGRGNSELVFQPYPVEGLIDKRLGDAYPSIELLANNIEKILYLADNISASTGCFELRGNIKTRSVQWRSTLETYELEEGWKELFSFKDLAYEINCKMDLLEELYNITNRGYIDLGRELDKVKKFVGYSVQSAP